MCSSGKYCYVCMFFDKITFFFSCRWLLFLSLYSFFSFFYVKFHKKRTKKEHFFIDFLITCNWITQNSYCWTIYVHLCMCMLWVCELCHNFCFCDFFSTTAILEHFILRVCSKCCLFLLCSHFTLNFFFAVHSLGFSIFFHCFSMYFVSLWLFSIVCALLFRYSIVCYTFSHDSFFSLFIYLHI